MPEKSPLNKLKSHAMYLLARRDHTQQELTLKLQLKQYPLPDIKATVADLAQQGLINDHRYTENFIYWRGKRGYGPQRISQELQSRGIPAETIAKHLDITDNAWFIEVQKVWKKHFKGRLPKDFKDKAKQMRFLQYRGYTREQIESVFGEIE